MLKPGTLPSRGHTALALVLLGAGAIAGYLVKKHALIGRIRFVVQEAIKTTTPPGDRVSVEELTRPRPEPARLVFDTDIGNDVDDVLALALIHELVNRREAELLAVTVSKDNPWCAPHVDVINTFYRRPDVPIGVVRDGMTTDDGAYNRAVVEKVRDGRPVYPRNLRSGSDAPDAVDLIRRVLAAQPDGSVVLVTVGFLSNAARLIESGPDARSRLTGSELVRTKIRLLVAMLGDFGPDPGPEYNAEVDHRATRAVLARWPTPVVATGFEIGSAVLFPAESIERDFAHASDHPVVDAYRAYMAMPYDRPTWDLTAVLFAVRPDRGYFGLSRPGTILLDGRKITRFRDDPEGAHRYLTISGEQIPRVREAFVQLVSAPPCR